MQTLGQLATIIGLFSCVCVKKKFNYRIKGLIIDLREGMQVPMLLEM